MSAPSVRARVLRRAAWRAVEALESRTLLSSVSGTVYADANANGAWDSGEAALSTPAVTVYADLNHAGHFESGDPSATTSSGAYTLTLASSPDAYTIAVEPVGGRVLSSGSRSVSLPADSSTATADFGEAPLPLTGLAASSISSGEIDLAWSLDAAYSGSGTGIEVDRSIDGSSFSTLATLSNTASGYQDTTVNSDTRYWYQVKEASGFAFDTPASNTADAYSAPAAPSSVNSSIDGSNTVTLNWTNNASSATTFTVGRSSDGGSTFSDFTPTGAGVTTWTDATAARETGYVYRVIARDNGQSSTASHDRRGHAAGGPVGAKRFGDDQRGHGFGLPGLDEQFLLFDRLYRHPHGQRHLGLHDAGNDDFHQLLGFDPVRRQLHLRRDRHGQWRGLDAGDPRGQHAAGRTERPGFQH